MIDDEKSFHQIRAVCRAREIDLLMVPAPAPFELALRGHFDGYNTFFEILAKEVDYLDLAGGLPVGDLLVTHDMKSIAGMSPKWEHVVGNYSGEALVLRSADAESWSVARPEHLFLIIAELTFRHGPDWAKVAELAGR